MSQHDTAKTDELWWADPQLKQRLLSDPVAALHDRGVGVPTDLPTPVLWEFVRTVFLLWVDGKITPINQFVIDPSDEGLLFGRGVWESTRTVGGVPWLWSWHVERLRLSANALGIPLAPERLPDTHAVSEYVRTLTSQDVVVRLNVTAGRPGHAGMVWMSAAVQPLPPASVRMKTRKSSIEKGPSYQTLKTFQYASRLQTGAEAARAGFDTALIIDESDNILEASHANIFVRLADGWVTPKADGGFLPGTVRQLVIQHAPLPVREQVLPVSALKEAVEVFVTNSNIGIVPVTQIDDRTFPVGAETMQLMKWLQPQQPPGVQYRFVERRGI